MEFQQGSAMLSEPRWFVDDVVKPGGIIDRTFIITLINLTTDEAMSRNGIGTVKMKLDPGSSVYYQSEYISSGMKIDVGYTKDSDTLDFTKAWENYFINTIKMNPEISTYSISDVNTLVVKMYSIKIESL
jgi:hypothetical protein